MAKFEAVDVEERFWSKVDKNGPNGCWLWLGSLCMAGYGQFWFSGRNILAHRFIWEMYNDEIPKGKSRFDFCICHTCDNRACVNPEHLFLGSDKDNIQDKVNKGRHPHGMTQAQAKLTDAAVREIRKSTLTQRQLAYTYGVNQATIWRAIHTNWQHVQ